MKTITLTKLAITVAVLFALGGLLAVVLHVPAPRARVPAAVQQHQAAAVVEQSAPAAAVSDEPGIYYPQAAQINRTPSPQDDVKLLAEMFLHYQRMVKEPGGNPVGLNAEITRAFTGRNRAQLTVIATNHPAISRDGELMDRWGRPYFFHALSGREMQVRSGGPDRRMWTDDDIVFPENQQVAHRARR